MRPFTLRTLILGPMAEKTSLSAASALVPNALRPTVSASLLVDIALTSANALIASIDLTKKPTTKVNLTLIN